STEVTGEAEAGSTVLVKAGTTELGTVEAGTDGKFSISIPKQAAGTEITVTATDEAGNVSEAVTVTVKDTSAPVSPTVNEVTDQSTEVTGEAEAGSTVLVKAGTTELGTVEAGTDGKFSVSIPKQAAGTEITVTATDKAGNVSEAATVIVKKETVYKQLETKTNVDPHYNFTVKLNNNLDMATVTSSNIYVKTNSILVDGVKVSLNADKKSIKVEAPEEGYKVGETYVIYVEKAVKSASGKELKQPVKMQFTIASNQ
ncbi:Ig-like domain-containing protein, partial [Domibacillus sp. PGB-M46]|uniref:Ig-like domain-containing protein n=1 Tax=Domibacillus sp. PGB-M46 TaxID=2910255 RepID=UPI001F5A1BE8